MLYVLLPLILLILFSWTLFGSHKTSTARGVTTKPAIPSILKVHRQPNTLLTLAIIQPKPPPTDTSIHGNIAASSYGGGGYVCVCVCVCLCAPPPPPPPHTHTHLARHWFRYFQYQIRSRLLVYCSYNFVSPTYAIKIHSIQQLNISDERERDREREREIWYHNYLKHFCLGIVTALNLYPHCSILPQLDGSH